MSAPADVDALLRRLHLPTVRRLHAELAVRAEAEGMSYRDFLAVLMAEEVAHRGETRIARSLRRAHFPFLMTIEQFDFTFQTSIRRAMLGSFLGPEFVSEGRCAIFTGPTGTGKTSLAIAIGYRAIQNGYEALFTDAQALLERLSLAARSDRMQEILPEYVHPHVLVIDEVGYLEHRSDAANVLFHVVNERHLKKRPTLFTTNKPLAAWGKVLHDPDLAEAIIDRVLERGRLFELRGPSYRTRHLRSEPRAGSGAAAVTSQAEPDPGPRRNGRRWPIISGKRGPEFPEPTPIFASGASTVSPLFRLLDTFRGTLVVDEADFRLSDEKAEVVKILNNGNGRGFPVLRTEATPNGKEFNPRAYVVFGPKLVATRQRFQDAALESRCLTEEMGRRPLRSDIPINLSTEYKAEALRLRNQLLTFRLRHGGKPIPIRERLDAAIEPRLNQVFAPLLTIIDDADTRKELQALARE